MALDATSASEPLATKMKFKITFLIAANFYGGVTRFFSELAKGLAKRGHDVTVEVALVPHWTYHQFITLRRLKKSQGFYFLMMHIVKGLLREGLRHRFRWVGESGSQVTIHRYFLRPNLRHLGEADWYFLCNNWYQVYEVDKFRGLFSRVIQFILHYEDYADDHLRRLVKRAYEVPFLRLTLCRANIEILTSKGVCVDGVIFGGINPLYFHPRSDKRDPKAILMYWGLEQRKGFRIGLEAMEKVRRHFPDVSIRLLCPSNRYPVPKGYRRSASLTDQELGDLLRAHSIFVYPSLMEGFGLPPLEAMACGCAVVTTRVGAVEEYAVHGRSAYIVEPGNPSTIAEGVERLLQNDKLREHMSREAALAAMSYTWDRSVDALEQFLNKHWKQDDIRAEEC